jgi:hypothetical protein
MLLIIFLNVLFYEGVFQCVKPRIKLFKHHEPRLIGFIEEGLFILYEIISEKFFGHLQPWRHSAKI